MNRVFFIVGLPRSRTAWLANLLTYGSSFCFHEALNVVDRVEELPGMFETVKAAVVGDADSGVSVMFEEINRLFPEARYVFVYRDFDDVRESMTRLFGNTFCQTADLAQSLKTIAIGILRIAAELPRNRRLRVDFKDLESTEVLNDINRFCTGRTFTSMAEKQRLRMLQTFKVEVMPQKVVEHLTPTKRNLWDGLKVREGSQLWQSLQR